MDERFSELLKQIYSAVEQLEAMFPGRHFTPDGHMVGSIGEAIRCVSLRRQALPGVAQGL
jgi:hypothetical protein